MLCFCWWLWLRPPLFPDIRPWALLYLCYFFWISSVLNLSNAVFLVLVGLIFWFHISQIKMNYMTNEDASLHFKFSNRSSTVRVLSFLHLLCRDTTVRVLIFLLPVSAASNRLASSLGEWRIKCFPFSYIVLCELCVLIHRIFIPCFLFLLWGKFEMIKICESLYTSQSFSLWAPTNYSRATFCPETTPAGRRARHRRFPSSCGWGWSWWASPKALIAEMWKCAKNAPQWST